mmetsp:Transcript_32652/g.86215  ORF Transcript_32652/g.86215 Transcript_32652/m.86215 type:complete len:242 (+) Transcript_32652:1179-1904(+)
MLVTVLPAVNSHSKVKRFFRFGFTAPFVVRLSAWLPPSPSAASKFTAAAAAASPPAAPLAVDVVASSASSPTGHSRYRSCFSWKRFCCTARSTRLSEVSRSAELRILSACCAASIISEVCSPAPLSTPVSVSSTISAPNESTSVLPSSPPAAASSAPFASSAPPFAAPFFTRPCRGCAGGGFTVPSLTSSRQPGDESATVTISSTCLNSRPASFDDELEPFVAAVTASNGSSPVAPAFSAA